MSELRLLWAWSALDSLPQTHRESRRNEAAKSDKHTLPAISVCHCVIYLHGHTVSHCCLAGSLCHSFVLRRRKAGAGPRHQSMNDLKALISTCIHTHIIIEVIRPTHTHTYRRHTVQFSLFGWLCRQHLFCALSSSLCTPPSVTGVGDSDPRATETRTHKAHRHMVSVFRLHTHIYTPAVWGSASVPCGARQAERRAACVHHLLSGQTLDEGLALTEHRRTATHIQWTDVYESL